MLGFFGLETTTTKERIIEILAIRPLLTSIQIHSELKQSGKRLSTQAVHKMLQEMVNAGILIKKNTQYSLNGEWVKKLKQKVVALEEKYLNSGKPENKG